MYLNGEKPGAGGGRGRGRGGPGAGGRGGLLTSPAGRGAPPPRSALLDTVCSTGACCYLVGPTKNVLVARALSQLVNYCIFILLFYEKGNNSILKLRYGN